MPESRPSSDRPAAPHLAAELEAALLRALAEAWSSLNENHFKGALDRPHFVLVDTRARLGEWRPATRTLLLQRTLVVDQPWGIVVEVLKHEMAHQYVSEVLGDPDGTPHGPTFRGLCDRLGIDARASGVPVAPGSEAPVEAEARILGKIAKLLALAESANRHEAEAAMARAQELMLKHNLDAPVDRRGYGFRHLGTPTGRTTEAERRLGGILGSHFFVEAIFVPVWVAREGRRATVLEVCGSPVNLEMAAYVYDFLHAAADRLWIEYKRAQGVRSNRDRQTFLAGVMAGFHDKLGAQAKRSASQGLVWVGDPELSRYYRRRHPYIRHIRRSGAARTLAHAHGRTAGQNLVLHRPVESRGASGRLLKGRS
jgi:Protein of unknown function (DUF2786)